MQEIDWQSHFKEEEDSHIWSKHLEAKINEAMELFIPKKPFKGPHPKARPKRTFYAPDTLLGKLHDKRKAFRYFKNHPTPEIKKAYHFHRILVKKECKQSVSSSRLCRDPGNR